MKSYSKDILRGYRRDKRNKYLCFVLLGIGAVVLVALAWQFAQIDLCPFYYQVDCLPN